MEPFFFVDIFDHIMLEYEKLSGNDEYSSNLDEVNYGISMKAKLIGLINCYYLLKINKEEAIKYLHLWGVDIDNDEEADFIKLKSIIKQIRTNINIANIDKVKSKKGEFDFEKALVNIEISLKKDIDIEKITVSKWCYYVNVLKSMANEYKKINNGRND